MVLIHVPKGNSPSPHLRLHHSYIATNIFVSNIYFNTYTSDETKIFSRATIATLTLITPTTHSLLVLSCECATGVLTEPLISACRIESDFRNCQMSRHNYLIILDILCFGKKKNL